MIRLNTPIESIVINLQSAGEVNYNIQYVFVRNGVTLNKSVEGILTTSGQHVVLINDYSSGYFDITYLNITNIDPAQNYISVLKKTNVNETNLTSEAIGLKNRECIEFTSDSGFKTLDQNGSFKTITSSVSADGDVENSDMSYMATVPSGGSLTLPDSQINVNGIDEGDVVSVKLIDVNLNDGIDIVVPTSIALVANTLTITVPGGEIDLEINGAPYDTVTAPATVDIPVINSALAPVGTINVLDVEIADSTVENSDSSYSVNVVAEGSLVLPDVTIEILDQFDVVIDTDIIPSVKNHLVDVFQYCPVADVENSDASYATTVVSGGTLVLPDQQINVNSVDEGDIPSVGTIDIDLSDGVNPVVPTSVTITGRTIDIEVPSGGGSYDIDLVDRFGNNIGTEAVTANANWDLRTLTPFDWADIFLSREVSWGGATIENALIQLCVDLKSWGSSNKVPVYYPNIGGTANNHRWNLMYPFNTNNGQRQLFANGFTHTNKGVVCTGNGASTFYHPNMVKTQIGIGAGFGFYQTTEFNGLPSGASKRFILENASSGRWSNFIIRNDIGRVTFACQGSDVIYTPALPPLTNIGNKTVVRVGGSVFYYVNGILENSAVSAYLETSGSQVFSNGYTLYGSASFDGNPYDASIGSVYFFIDGLNSTEITEFNTIVQTFENIVR